MTIRSKELLNAAHIVSKIAMTIANIIIILMHG